MSLQSVKTFLKEYGLEDRILIFEDSSATVAQAAKVLNTQEERIAKTLSFLVEDEPVIVVCAGDQKIDNKKYKSFFKAKAKMIPASEVERITGHEVGGVCPFGLNGDIRVYLDESLQRFDTVFPACGTRNSAIELTPGQLETITGAKWIDVCRPIQN